MNDDRKTIIFDGKPVTILRPKCLGRPGGPQPMQTVAGPADSANVACKECGKAFVYDSQYDAPELVCDFIGDWWLLLGLLPDLPEYAVPRCAMKGAPDLAYKDIQQRHNALADAIALRNFKPDIQPDTD
jgi:hypothetical protein